MNHDLEAYLDGALSPEESAEFEAQLARDEALSEALVVARKLRDDLSWQMVNQGILSGEHAFWEKQSVQKKRNRWMWLMVVFTLAIGAGILWWRWEKPPTSVIQETPPIATPPQHKMPGKPDSIKPETPEKPDVLQRQPNDTPSPGRLFAQNFKPYKDESMEPSVRGDQEPSPAEKFQQLYWNNEFSSALIQFENLSVITKNNDNLLFIKAECLLALGKADQAAPVLALIIKNDRSRYMEAATWHLALAYLKTGKIAQAKSQLQKIVQSKASPWKAAAAALMKQL